MACCFKQPTVEDDDGPTLVAGKFAADNAPAGHVVNPDSELKSRKASNARPARISNGAAHSGRAPRLSMGDTDDEWHDAEDTMPSLDPTWANSPSSKEIGSILEEHGIKLEVREAPAEGIGRCLIPRLDIPFEKPGDGDTLSWSANPLGQGFRLRGKQYKKDRKKFPSEKPLYDVVHVLAFRSDKQKLDFGELIFGGDVGEIIHGCPTVYIANLMLPDYPPANPLWGKKEKGGPDGPGQHIVVVARMTEETRAELERCGGDVDKMAPEVGLMARHFRAGPHDENGMDMPPHPAPVRHCTKMVCMVADGQQELPMVVRVAIGQGNGKPFMVNKTGYFTKHEGKGYFEIAVNAHNFGQFATNGLRNCHSFFKHLVLDIGVTLQGDHPDELPERLLFAFRAVKPDLHHIQVHVNELDEEAKSIGKGREARPWLSWDELKMPGT